MIKLRLKYDAVGVEVNMSSNERYFLSFLENIVPEATEPAKKMEELMYEDPSSSIIKARIFAEKILNKVFKFISKLCNVGY